MSIVRNILSSTLIQILGKAAVAALALVTIKYITSLETIPGLSGIPAEYKLIYTYLTFFGIIADFGLFTIAVREMSKEEPSRTPYILGNIFGMRLFTILSAMLLASLVVFLIPGENYTSNVKIGVAFAAITTVFTMLASTISSVLQVKLKMTAPTVALILGKIIMTVYIAIVAINYQQIPYAFYHLLAAGIFGTIVTFVITYFYTYKIVNFSPKFDFKYWKKIFYEAAPYGLAIILSTIYFKVDVILLSFLREKQEIAIYGFPSSIIEIILVIPHFFLNSVLPTLTRSISTDIEKAKTVIKYSANFLWLLAAPMAVGGFVLARPIIAWVMNESFLTGNVTNHYGADTAFQIIILGLLFSFLTTLWSFVLVAHHEQKKLLKINAIGVILNVALNLTFIPTYGFRAAAIATLASQLLMMAMTYLHCKKFIDIKIDTVTFLKIAIAAVVMGISTHYISPFLHISLTIIIGGLIFGVLLFPLKVIDGNMMALLRKKN